MVGIETGDMTMLAGSLFSYVMAADTNPVSASDSVTFHMGGGVRT
jgi:hypothetical protein